MNCNPNAVACQLELIRQSIDNPNTFQIWGLIVAIIAALGSVAVAVVAAAIAWRSTKAAESANEEAKSARAEARAARERDEARAAAIEADEARKERYEYSELVRKYLITAAAEWGGQKKGAPANEQWVAIATRASALRTVNESGAWLGRSASRLVDRINATEKRSLIPDEKQIKRISELVVQQSTRTMEWVADPQRWLDLYWAPEAAEIRAEAEQAATIRPVGVAHEAAASATLKP